MSDIVCSSVQYSATVDLDVLVKHLDSDFVGLLCRTLHVDSLKLAHVYVDHVSNALTFTALRIPDDV